MRFGQKQDFSLETRGFFSAIYNRLGFRRGPEDEIYNQTDGKENHQRYPYQKNLDLAEASLADVEGCQVRYPDQEQQYDDEDEYADDFHI